MPTSTLAGPITDMWVQIRRGATVMTGALADTCLLPRRDRATNPPRHRTARSWWTCSFSACDRSKLMSLATTRSAGLIPTRPPTPRAVSDPGGAFDSFITPINDSPRARRDYKARRIETSAYDRDADLGRLPPNFP